MKVTTGARLKQIMSERNLKQVDILNLAEKYFKDGVKISKTDLSQYVNGKTEPRQEKLYILAEALDVSEAWLMGYDIDRERISIDERLREVRENAPTYAAHHDGEDWTEEELEEIERFKEFIKNKRNK
ncbi:bifunctional HTH-domain containing protein/aminotransferase [Oceanobacillus picturae]|uniref:Bifunctional HTH-domain containing protein/aminotransferase n=1 Tax=Oceanobacillus picturae TaxID=171693 RepID=W9AKF9_9BACI|nr:helix-turn-helix domain-containing protein [Oceanobacillus picturae]CDO03136.1 bifunctional HTH-domain containing protein/aminotransferase [Oceanobacillus picturae]